MATLDLEACAKAIDTARATARATEEASRVAVHAAAERIASSILARLPFALELSGCGGLLRLGGCETPPTREIDREIHARLLEATGVPWVWEGGNIWATNRAELEAAILSKCATA